MFKVNGERSPTEVYSDFRSSVLQILSAHKGSAPAVVVVPNGDARPDDERPPDAADRDPSERPKHATDPVVPVVSVDRRHRSQPAAFPRVICVVGEWNGRV